MQNLAWFYPEGHQSHIEIGHPERPERIESIKRVMDLMGWWEPFPKLRPLPLSREFLETVHSRHYLNLLEGVCESGDHLDPDTYTTSTSWNLALNAAGGAAAIAQAVWNPDRILAQGTKIRGFALTRPPGHHAERDRGMGFCLINNVAVAAEYLISHPIEGSTNAKRVAIVDLDLHHGNGTQDIFWERSDVLFISTHQFPLYPGTGAITEIGAHAGEGYTVNLPLPPGTGDTGYLVTMSEIIIPVLDRFKPEIILVSAGFDAHWRDPLGHLALTASGFGELIKKLVQWVDHHSDGKIALMMEGGYDTMAMGACAMASVAALIDAPFDDPIGASPREEGKSWQMVINKAKEIWQL